MLKQAFEQVGIYFDQLIFIHKQLYVALSRVFNFLSLTVLIKLFNNIQRYHINFKGKSAYCTYIDVYMKYQIIPLTLVQINYVLVYV